MPVLGEEREGHDTPVTRSETPFRRRLLRWNPAAGASTLAASVPGAAEPVPAAGTWRAGASRCVSLAIRSIPYSCLMGANACAQGTAAAGSASLKYRRAPCSRLRRSRDIAQIIQRLVETRLHD